MASSSASKLAEGALRNFKGSTVFVLSRCSHLAHPQQVFTMFKATHSPQFSGYWCIWGNPKKALEAYKKVREIPKAEFLAEYEDQTSGVYAFFVHNLAKDGIFKDPQIRELLEPYNKHLTIEHEKASY